MTASSRRPQIAAEPSAAGAAIDIVGLGKRFGGVWALKGCTLQLPAGRVVALVGPNGAGKTTLLHTVVGLIEPSCGSIEVFGQQPAASASGLAMVGFVAQDHPLYPGYSVAEMLRMGEKLNPHWDQVFAERRLAVARVPLQRKVRSLSGGEQAQVALSMALAKRPRLLALDEPVASLDPLARREFMATLMADVADAGTTVLLSSHVVAELERVCDYLVVLAQGRVQVAGDIDELLAQHHLLVGPRTPGAAEWIPGVLRVTHTERQTTVVVNSTHSLPPAGWTEHSLNLEELVLAYLREPDCAALPGPLAVTDSGLPS